MGVDLATAYLLPDGLVPEVFVAVSLLPVWSSSLHALVGMHTSVALAILSFLSRTLSGLLLLFLWPPEGSRVVHWQEGSGMCASSLQL
jgi:hypothetical protein